jgi:hypothetical protein
MQCKQFEDILEQQDEGALPVAALAHLDVCGECRTLAADLEAIRKVATELDAETAAPPERVWVSLRNQLEMEGIIREPSFAAHGVERTETGWWNFLQRPAFAGSFLTIALAAAALLGYQSNSPQIGAQAQLFPAQETSIVPTAESVFKEEMLTVGNGSQRQDAAVTDSIHRNLGIVDNFIAMCEKSVREQPDNALAREYLYGAYQQKAELLATATNRDTMGGLQ